MPWHWYKAYPSAIQHAYIHLTSAHFKTCMKLEILCFFFSFFFENAFGIRVCGIYIRAYPHITHNIYVYRWTVQECCSVAACSRSKFNSALLYACAVYIHVERIFCFCVDGILTGLPGDTSKSPPGMFHDRIPIICAYFLFTTAILWIFIEKFFVFHAGIRTWYHTSYQADAHTTELTVWCNTRYMHNIWHRSEWETMCI